MNRGVIKDEDQQGLGKPLRELMQKRQEQLRRAAWGAFPIKLLGGEVSRPKEIVSLLRSEFLRD
jgi:hypothetical protein